MFLLSQHKVHILSIIELHWIYWDCHDPSYWGCHDPLRFTMAQANSNPHSHRSRDSTFYLHVLGCFAKIKTNRSVSIANIIWHFHSVRWLSVFFFKMWISCSRREPFSVILSLIGSHGALNDWKCGLEMPVAKRFCDCDNIHTCLNAVKNLHHQTINSWT